MNVIVKKARPTQAQIIKELRAKVKVLDKTAHEALDMYVAESNKVKSLTKELSATANSLEKVMKTSEQNRALADLFKERLDARNDEITRLEAAELILTLDKAAADVGDNLLGRMRHLIPLTR